MNDETKAELMRALTAGGLPETDAMAMLQIGDYQTRCIGNDTIGTVRVSTISMPAMADEAMYWETRIDGVPKALAKNRFRWINEEVARSNHEILVTNFRALKIALNEVPE